MKLIWAIAFWTTLWIISPPFALLLLFFILMKFTFWELSIKAYYDIYVLCTSVQINVKSSSNYVIRLC